MAGTTRVCGGPLALGDSELCARACQALHRNRRPWRAADVRPTVTSTRGIACHAAAVTQLLAYDVGRSLVHSTNAAEPRVSAHLHKTSVREPPGCINDAHALRLQQTAHMSLRWAHATHLSKHHASNDQMRHEDAGHTATHRHPPCADAKKPGAIPPHARGQYQMLRGVPNNVAHAHTREPCTACTDERQTHMNDAICAPELPTAQPISTALRTQSVGCPRNIFRQTLNDANHFTQFVVLFSECVCNAQPHLFIINPRCAIALRTHLQNPCCAQALVLSSKPTDPIRGTLTANTALAGVWQRNHANAHENSNPYHAQPRTHQLLAHTHFMTYTHVRTHECTRRACPLP